MTFDFDLFIYLFFWKLKISNVQIRGPFQKDWDKLQKPLYDTKSEHQITYMFDVPTYTNELCLIIPWYRVVWVTRHSTALILSTLKWRHFNTEVLDLSEQIERPKSWFVGRQFNKH